MNTDPKHWIRDWRAARKEICRTGGMQKRKDTGQEGYGTGGLQERRYVEQEVAEKKGCSGGTPNRRKIS